jgi:hypothetical protein
VRVPGFKRELARQREIGGVRFARTLRLAAGTRRGTAVATVRNGRQLVCRIIR